MQAWSFLKALCRGLDFFQTRIFSSRTPGQIFQRQGLHPRRHRGAFWECLGSFREHLEHLRASSSRRWRDKGGFWGASGFLRKPLENLWESSGKPWEPSGCLWAALEVSWVLLGSPEPLGPLGPARGKTWAASGNPRGAFGRVWKPLGSESLLSAGMESLWDPHGL